MKKKNCLLSLLAMIMVAMLSVGFASCGSDDDDEEMSGSFLVGEWHECETDGTLLNDATESEVHHMKLYSNGNGDYWSISKGKEDELKFSFKYSYSLNGSNGIMTTTITSSSRPSIVGEVETASFTIENGILHLGEIYYKKISNS